MKKILVPIDGSDVSLRAVDFAKSMFELQDKATTIFSVIPDNVNYYITNAELLDQISATTSDKTETLLKNIVADFEDVPGRVNYHYTMGDPAHEIVKFAEDNDYDIIVMGSRGLGTFSKTILGSVSTKVLNKTKKTVVIVK